MRNFLIIAVSLTVVTCSSTQSPDIPDIRTGEGLEQTDDTTVRNIFQYYYDLWSVDSSEEHLDSLFALWYNTFGSNENEMNLDNEEKEILSIYKAAYQPLGFPEDVGSEWGNLNENAEYLVVDCKVNYTIVKNYSREVPDVATSESLDTLRYDSLCGVRPDLKLEKPHVYLADGFERGIQQFLGGEYTPAGSPSTMSPASGSGETANRAAFLARKITLFHYHWFEGYHLASHPKIYSIVLNEQKTKATVYFSIIYQGGNIFVEKQNGKWVITNAVLTWIT